MSDYRLTTLARAIRSQLGLSTSIAVGVALISTPAANATTIPQMLPEQNLLRMENAITNRELVFIDADVPDPQRLLIGLKQGVETIILDRNQGGIEQITRVLEARTDISAVHIVAHGEAGLLKLGNTRLDIEELNNKAILLRRWFKDSGQGKPDLLLYACDVAKGEGGAAFVEQLAVLTGADVAASTDKTGIGGDWDLEYNVGDIETALAFKEEDLAAYPHSLASFTVTKTADTNDGTCDADCSLREAVAAANASVGTDSIGFSTGVAGVIALTSGQITITESLVINGPGAGLLEISGNSTNRIFDFTSGNAFTIRDLTLAHGNASGHGGAIRSSDCCSTELRIEDSVITGNTSSGHGGGIYQDQGDVYIIRSEISNNYAGNDGGGINHYQHRRSDYLVIVDSLISNNEARRDGGGFSTDGEDIGSRTIFNSVFTKNVAGDDGGGMFIYSDDDDAYNTYITDTTISNNTAGDDGGGIFFYADDDGYLFINNSTISGNTAGDNGGGISFYSGHGDMEINNSTISGNYAYDNGGGIFVDRGDVDIHNSTIAFNEAGRRGGGIYNDRQDVYVYNSIIAENTAGSGGQDVYSSNSGTFAIRYTLLGDTSQSNYSNNGSGNIVDTPSGISPNLTSAGGPTKVHLLELGSPALNSGETGFTQFEFDQRGRGSLRVAGGRLDMGAVEMQDPPLPIPTLQNWALILLALLLPGMALGWRKRLEKKQLAS